MTQVTQMTQLTRVTQVTQLTRVTQVTQVTQMGVYLANGWWDSFAIFFLEVAICQ